MAWAVHRARRHARGRPVPGGVPHAVVVITVGIALLVRQYAGEVERARAEQLEAARLSAGARAAEAERRTRLAQIEQLAAPVLLLLRDGGVDGGGVDERLATECRLLEAALRDGIRGRLLVDPAVRETLWAARTRGVEVTLLDDSGTEVGDTVPAVADVAAPLPGGGRRAPGERRGDRPAVRAGRGHPRRRHPRRGRRRRSRAGRR